MVRSDGEPEAYWYNLKTGVVEYGRLTASQYRVGPFATEAEAKDALKTLSERSKAWNTEEENES